MEDLWATSGARSRVRPDLLNQQRTGRRLRKGISQAVSSVLVTPGKASVKLRKRDVPKAACFQLNNMAPPLTEAKRLENTLKNVAYLGLSMQQSTSSGRDGYRTYKSLPVLTEALSYQSNVRLSKSSNTPKTGASEHIDEDPRTEGSVKRKDDFVSLEEE
ncbi:hypothetical protein ACH5RR_013017 [Cinchona calisaya]|uniref:Uncharacterized protein n=1 Tax=Cinchona calisaya TaxID=153742 RepID=A0ABD2ZYV4_9GENT